jgi:hypothetical protein
MGAKGLRRNKFTFWRERRMGRCKAPRHRRCGTSSRSGNAADAHLPPRLAAECEVIFAQPLRILFHIGDIHAAVDVSASAGPKDAGAAEAVRGDRSFQMKCFDVCAVCGID